MKKEFFTEEDFYRTSNGQFLRGGNHRLYEAELAIKILRDGTYEVLKDRKGLSKSEIEREISYAGIDERLLLIM